MNQKDVQSIQKAQSLGLLDKYWAPTARFVDLAVEAVSDINDDPQYRQEVLQLATRPEVVLLSHIIDNKKLLTDSFIFTCTAKRMLELIGEDDNYLGKFLAIYLSFLQHEGALKLRTEPRV